MEHNLFDTKGIERIKKYLIKKNETVSVAESVTSGLLQAALAMANDATKFFQGGITAYNLGQKSRHLFVEPIHAIACNCVSLKVAEEMALNVCRLFNSNWGIAITGYSSPVPESGNKLFCYYAIAHNNKTVVKAKITHPDDEPFNVQLKYVSEIIDAFNASVS